MSCFGLLLYRERIGHDFPLRAGDGGLDGGAARHALARGLVIPAAATAGDERDREQRCEPQLLPASERQIDVTSAMYVSVSSLGAPPAFVTAVGPALYAASAVATSPRARSSRSCMSLA